MKSPTKTNRFTLLALLCLIPIAAGAAYPIPDRPEPQRLVNDLAGVLGDQAGVMEDTLEAFARRTSNQIVVLTVNDLGDYEPWEFAQQTGQQWGVGGAKFNNGVVILVKPKTEASRGQAFIATGYGMEGALTDLACRQIVNREMIPAFKQNDYASGVWRALRVVMPIAEGEYSEQQYLDKAEQTAADTGADLIVAIIVLVYVIYRIRNLLGGGGFGGFGGGGAYTGTWGSPSSWSHSSGSSGGGGFGGFGGGSFGGGGGGGSW